MGHCGKNREAMDGFQDFLSMGFYGANMEKRFVHVAIKHVLTMTNNETCPKCGAELTKRVGAIDFYQCGSSDLDTGTDFTQSDYCLRVVTLENEVKELRSFVEKVSKDIFQHWSGQIRPTQLALEASALLEKKGTKE